MRTKDNEREIQKNIRNEPGMDPLACSGRTTRMIQRVVDTVIDIPNDCVVIGNSRYYNRYLMDLMCSLLEAYCIPYKRGRSACAIEFNEQTVYFRGVCDRSGIYQLCASSNLNVFQDNR